MADEEPMQYTFVGVEETPWLVGKTDITFDGVDQREAGVKVTRANAEKGWIEYFVLLDGHVVEDPIGELKRERKYGKVTITRREDADKTPCLT